MPRKWTSLIMLLLWAAVLPGCWESDHRQNAPVSGIVTLDSEPLSGAFVNFQPNGGLGSTGMTDSEGKYSLTTIDKKRGAVIGSHRVTIYSAPSREGAKTDSDLEDKPKERVPERYNYRTTLTLKVTSEGTDQANWDLSSE